MSSLAVLSEDGLVVQEPAGAASFLGQIGARRTPLSLLEPGNGGAVGGWSVPPKLLQHRLRPRKGDSPAGRRQGRDTPPATSASAAPWAVTQRARPAGTAPGAAGSTRARQRPRIPVGNPCPAPRPFPAPGPCRPALAAAAPGNAARPRGAHPSCWGGRRCRSGAPPRLGLQPPRLGLQPRFSVAGGLKLRAGTPRGRDAAPLVRVAF